MARTVLRGTISSAAFPSGDRFVVGHWVDGPLGPMGDVMWATPDDHRILLAPDDAVAAFVTGIYDFDEVRVGPLVTTSDGRRTTVLGHGLDLEVVGGRRRSIPVRRPLAVTRLIERPIAAALMGVQTFGTSPGGAVEWYQTSGWRWVRGGRAHLHGDPLGSPLPVCPPLGVGFSEPPRRPAIVAVRVTIDLPAGAPLGAIDAPQR